MLPCAATLALPAGLALATLLAAGSAEAKAAYMDLPGAVEASTEIAIIHTEASAPCEITVGHWTYSQKVFAKPTEVLKGELTSPLQLLAAKDFICASVRYETPADYLVMLYREDGHLTTVNHEMGALRIDGAHVEWPYGSEDTIPLVDAREQIQALVDEQPAAPAAEVAPEPLPQATEPLPCGYAVSRMEQREKEQRMWRIAGAVGAGGAAVILGFMFGFRRRRRSPS